MRFEDLRPRPQGCKVSNARITDVSLSMREHGILCLYLILEGDKWSCCYGGYAIGKGGIDWKDEEFSASDKGLIAIMQIMAVVGVDRFEDMEGKYIRVLSDGKDNWGDKIIAIGNIIKNKWFSYDYLFKKERE